MSWNECPSCGLALRTIEEMETGRCSVCSPLQIEESVEMKVYAVPIRWDGRQWIADWHEGKVL